MTPLSSLQDPDWLLSFDFDGTLHDPASVPSVPPEFFHRLNRLRSQRRACWGINTGRSLEHLIEGFVESGFPFLPDWVVAREREIYFPAPDGGWMAHEVWNRNAESRIAELFEQQQLLLEWIRREVEEHTGAQWLEMEGEPAGVISRTEEEMEWIVGRVMELADPESDLSWQRNTIYLRFSHRGLHKGSCLSEIARGLGVPAAHCFAMGDSHNDIEMLDPEHAGMTACPANALDLVRERVRAHGGWVAASVHGHGVIEALDHYFST